MDCLSQDGLHVNLKGANYLLSTIQHACCQLSDLMDYGNSIEWPCLPSAGPKPAPKLEQVDTLLVPCGLYSSHFHSGQTGWSSKVTWLHMKRRQDARHVAAVMQ